MPKVEFKVYNLPQKPEKLKLFTDTKPQTQELSKFMIVWSILYVLTITIMSSFIGFVMSFVALLFLPIMLFVDKKVRYSRSPMWVFCTILAYVLLVVFHYYLLPLIPNNLWTSF